MNDTNILFLNLIRVAIGNQACLSRTPKVKEWLELYAMAKKQSLVGICFAGVQKLQTQRQAPNSWGNEQGEMLYLQWMGMAAKIQQRNEVVNKQCVEVQKRFEKDGLKSVILKGQGVAQLYPEHLRALRQSGDIDVYVKGGFRRVVGWCLENGASPKYDYVHTHADIFKDTEVEVHYRYGCLYNPIANKRLQKWLDEHEQFEDVNVGGGDICVPTAEFNMVYMMHHMFRHLFVEGIGLRQVLDYYFVLKSTKLSAERKQEIQSVLSSMGMLKFARAVMWIMRYVFLLEDDMLICNPDKEEGQYLLKEIMQMGNFGHYDERFKSAGRNRWQQMLAITRHCIHLVKHYPMESLSAPLWHVYHFCWKRTAGRINFEKRTNY